MRYKPLIRGSVLLLLACVATTVGQSLFSTYTSVEEKKCKQLKSSDAEGGEYEGECPGYGGYKLLVTEGDLRQNVTVVTPQGAKHSLELWDVVSGGFSSLGPKAEWRLARPNTKLVPAALILRYNASENPEKPEKITSYLVVVKITPDEICVTDKILPGPNANADARHASDIAATKPCLKKQQ